MTFSSFDWGGWKWCDNKLIMVPVWFTENQLPTTDMKRSHKVKVTKKDVYLRDDNLADDQENITEPKRKRKQNWIGLKLLVKKDLLISFMKVTMKTKMFKCQNNSIDKESNKFLTFILVQILLINGYFKNCQTECFIKKQPTRDVLQ